MKAYQVIEHKKPLEVRQIPKPVPTGHQILAKTLVSGVCHTDVHVAAGDWGALKLPLTPGHEGVGIVEAVGPDVTTMKVGDRVGVAWLGSTCMDCYLCKAGRLNLCAKQTQTGFVHNGSFAEYFIADERFAARIPDAVSDAEAAPVLCAGVTSYKALLLANVQPGARIAISGACGGLGHLAIQYAKAMGYEVVALVSDSEKGAMTKSLGADFIINLRDENMSLVEKFQALQPTKAIEASLVFAPCLQAVSDAVKYVSPGATIVAVGLPPGHFQIDVVDFIIKELRLQGSIVGTPKELAEAFRYVAEGKVKAHVEEKEFSCVNEVLTDLEQAKIRGRVVLRISN